MKHLDELLEQDKFEKGIRRILEIINKKWTSQSAYDSAICQL